MSGNKRRLAPLFVALRVALSIAVIILSLSSILISCSEVTAAGFEFDGDILGALNQDTSSTIYFKKDIDSEVAFTLQYKIGQNYTASELPGNDSEKVAALKPGFDLTGWKPQTDDTAASGTASAAATSLSRFFTLDENGYIQSFHMPAVSLTLYGGGYTASTDTPYKIIYKIQNITMDGYEYYSEQAMTGTTTTPEAPSYTDATNNLIEIEGFTALTASINEQEIQGDGSTVVEVLYNRNPYTLTVHSNPASGTAEATETQTFYYGVPAQINPNTFTRSGCSFAGWATTLERAAAGTVDYTDGANYTIRTGDADLYAVWTLPHVSITITLPGADEVGVTYELNPSNANLITLSAVIPAGHTADDYNYKWFRTNQGPSNILSTLSSFVLDTTSWSAGYYQITLIAELVSAPGVPAGGGTIQIHVE